MLDIDKFYFRSIPSVYISDEATSIPIILSLLERKE
jgi:hypothetical protein